MKVLVDDFVDRSYFGVILTGGEPTLHPELPKIAAYARERGLHVRMITNGHRLAEERFAEALGEAGLQLVHVSVYSIDPEVEQRLRGAAGTLERAYAAVKNANRFGIEVNINCVINKLNANHLDKNIEYWIENHPYIRHFIWNNLDPSMGRAEVNQGEFTPKLGDFEASLHRAMTLLHNSGRTFRVEKVPLCYMTDFAWASTETRKIVKGEERIVHFLDNKQTVRQTDWEHIYSESCDRCSLRTICGGLFDRGNGYDPAELHPVFVSRDTVVESIIRDPSDPSYEFRSIESWQKDFDQRCADTLAGRIKKRPSGPDSPENGPADDLPPEQMRPQGPAVGAITEQSQKLYETKRRREGQKAEKAGIRLEHADVRRPTERATDE